MFANIGLPDSLIFLVIVDVISAYDFPYRSFDQSMERREK